MTVFLYFLIIFLNLLIVIYTCKEPHERNFFRLSENSNNCEEACLIIGGTFCAHDYDIPENPEDVYDNSKYDIMVVCCSEPCEPGVESDPYHYLPYCKGKYLKFTC